MSSLYLACLRALVRLLQSEAPAERALRPTEYMRKYSFHLNQNHLPGRQFPINDHFVLHLSRIGDLVVL